MFFNRFKKHKLNLNIPKELQINNIIYQIEYSFQKQRSSTIRIKDQKIILRFSKYLSSSDTQKHAETLLSRIKKQLGKINPKHNLNSIKFQNGEKLVTFKDIYELRFIESVKRFQIKVLAPYINIYFPSQKNIPKNYLHKLIRKKIAEYYYPEIQTLILKINQKYFKAKYQKISLKEMHSRWGSCSSGKNINLSNKLLFASYEMLEYVIIHELAHLIIPNHSKSFWELVSKAAPNYKQLRKKLRAYIV